MDLYRHGFTGNMLLENINRTEESPGGIKKKLVRSIFLNALYR